MKSEGWSFGGTVLTNRDETVRRKGFDENWRAEERRAAGRALFRGECGDGSSELRASGFPYPYPGRAKFIIFRTFRDFELWTRGNCI